jgi:copper homeostasis protein (lipoprotein)
MNRACVSLRFLGPLLVFGAGAYAQSTPPKVTSDLGGTSWQLMKFQGRNGATLTPDDLANYTVALDTDGRVTVRIACNRGHGTWESVKASQLEFGPLALTRAMCPPAPLNDRIPQDWPYLRSYTLKNGRLLLSLVSDRGTYAFEPVNPEGPVVNASTISGLPATFIGTLPCADCPGIRYQLDLLPDHRFVSRMTYEERNTRFDDGGHWQLRADGKILTLHGGGGAQQEFALPDGDTLRQLDSAGHEIVSKLNYDLKRAPTFTVIAARSEETANASLENIDWTLILLGDSGVNVTRPKVPHLVLNSTTKRVSGSGGCNQLAGNYTLDGDHLSFRQIAGTMMACLEGMEIEKAFLQVLPQVTSWKINGQRLDLFDTRGRRIACLEARNIK